MTEEIIVKVQSMFPNCQKYNKCCRIDKPFWDELNEKVKDWKPVKQPFRIKNVKLVHTKPPKGFEGW